MPDDIFFEYLPVDHVLTLHVLLIHDGLSVEHLSIVLNKDREETQRILFQLLSHEREKETAYIKMRLKAYVLDIRYEFAFKSQMTEIVLQELRKEKII